MHAKPLTKQDLKKELKALQKSNKKLNKKKKETKKELAKASKTYKSLKQKLEKLELSLKQHSDAMLAVNTLLSSFEKQEAEASNQELLSAEKSEEKQTEDKATLKSDKKIKPETPQAKIKQEDTPKPKEANKAATSKASTTKKAASRHKKDDLKLIDGIGPTLERLLNEVNIRTWAQLAKVSQTKLKLVLTKAGPRLSKQNPETWPEQALLARDGRFEELKLLQDNLKTNS